MANETQTGVTCAECGEGLPDGQAHGAGVPCPTCGSTRRIITASPAAGHIRVRGSMVRATVTHSWDGVSLTLFGVLYGILVTVAGVVVAMVGTGGSWLWWAIYGAVSIGVLGLILLVVPQYAIRAMRWLIERAMKAPLGREELGEDRSRTRSLNADD